MAEKNPTDPETTTYQASAPAPDSEPAVEPTADGVTTTLDDDGNIVPLARHEASYNHATGAFE